MRHTPARHRLGLMLLLAGLTLFFVWDSVHGQGFRPRPGTGMPGGPRPPIGPGGGMGGGFEQVYSCSKCGKEVGRGKSMLDRPASCQFCGVKFINGGFGNGNTTPGNPGAAPGMMPGTNPGMMPGMNPGIPPVTAPPPPQNPIAPAPDPAPQVPAQPPIAAPVMPITAAPTTPVTTGNPGTQSTSSGSKWLIPGIVAIVVLTILGAGGVWMMIASSMSNNSPPKRSRSRRRRDDDDYDD